MSIISSIPDQWPHIDCEKVILTAINIDDIDQIFDIYSDSVVMEFASDPPYRTHDTVIQHIQNVKTDFFDKNALHLGVRLTNNMRIIGTCEIFDFDPSCNSVEMGCLLNRRYWGNGYMASSVRGLISYAGEHLGITEFRADIDSSNLRSIALFKRVGFVEDTYRDPSGIGMKLKTLNVPNQSEARASEISRIAGGR